MHAARRQLRSGRRGGALYSSAHAHCLEKSAGYNGLMQSGSSGGPRDRLRTLSAQLDQLRGGPTTAPSQAPPPLAPGRTQPLLLVLVEMAVNHLAVGELDATRAVIGEAAPLFHEVKD